MKWWYTKRVPDKIQYIEKDLASNLGVTYIPNKQFYAMYPLITKNNDVGIYLYKKISPHLPTCKVFMYNGDTIFFTNIEDSLGMKTFIDSNRFSKHKIRKFNKDTEVIKKNNETVNQRW